MTFLVGLWRYENEGSPVEAPFLQKESIRPIRTPKNIIVKWKARSRQNVSRQLSGNEEGWRAKTGFTAYLAVYGVKAMEMAGSRLCPCPLHQ